MDVERGNKWSYVVTLRPNERSINLFRYKPMTDEKADKKHAIFESTLDLIREHGFHGAPMSLVAKNAGVAAGTIYHYFESKEQLICELYHYNRQRITQTIESSIDTSLTYKENFFRIWTNVYGFYVEEPNVLIFFEQYINSPFNDKKTLSYSRGKLFEFFSAGIKKGIMKSVKPEYLILLVFGSISSAAKLHLFGKVAISKADLHRIAEILWDGIVSREEKSTTHKSK